MVPRISIGLPVFNGEAYLRRALDSVLSQDFESFELIISDNASTDATERICREFVSRDRRILYSRNPTNIGASANYRRVFHLARGEFFKWASHDDEFHPTMLRRCLEALEASPRSTVLAFPRCVVIDGNGGPVEPSPDTIRAFGRPHARLASLVFHAKYAHPLWGLIRSAALRRTRLMGNFEADHVLLAELALLGDFVEVPDVLYRLRRHPGSAMNRCRPRELLRWHDPTAKEAILLPQSLRVEAEYIGAIRHIDLPAAERLLCYGALTAVPCWRSLLRWTGGFRHRVGLYRRRSDAGPHVSTPVVAAADAPPAGHEPPGLR